nr:uncharacterized mitochondrial protein AtMg00810-like [Tanacetum cinerariifolium]
MGFSSILWNERYFTCILQSSPKGGDKLVWWSSKKQNCVSISTAESEYVAVSSCCAQVLWMRTQLTDYGFFYDKVPIYCDSNSAIAISCNLGVGNKMHKAFSLPVMEFPLPGEVPTASEESFHCQKKRDATAQKIALLLKSSSNCQSKSGDTYA